MRHELALGGEGGALRPYQRTEGADEYALALAAHAASLLADATAANEAQQQSSMLDTISKPQARVQPPPSVEATDPTPSAMPEPEQPGPSTQLTTEPADPPPAEPAKPTDPKATPDAEAAATPSEQQQIPAPNPPAEPAVEREAAPAVSADLVIKSLEGKLHENVVLRVQDVGSSKTRPAKLQLTCM